ncbi:hypothetical protein L1887_19902 [Cichorium endivia]|nr:hypothetical protein L1887_19902 [Cichorium endivia]
MMGVSIQLLMDLTVAGISLMIGFGIFAFVASILCSAAFFHNAKGHSSIHKSIMKVHGSGTLVETNQN